MVKNRIIYALLVAAIIVFYIFYYGWYSEFVLLLLLCLPVLSFLFGAVSAKSFKMEINAPKTAKKGDKISVKVKTTCGWFFSIYKIKLKTTLLPYGEENNEKRESDFSGETVFDVDTSFAGLTTVDFSGTAVYDFLGLFKFKIKGQTVKEILILPEKTVPDVIPDFRILNAVSKKAVRGPADEYDIRDYRAGDGLNQIHWKISAKTDKIMVKEGLEPQKRKNIISLDLNGTKAETESVFGQLVWIADELFESGNDFELHLANKGKSEGICVCDNESLQKALYTAMKTPRNDCRDDFKAAYVAGTNWHYRISPKKAVKKL